MTNPTRFQLCATLLSGALMLCISFAAAADEIQEAGRLLKQGQHAQALERVNSYLDSSPKDAQARFLKGLILTEQGKAADAISVFTALTEDYPELPEPYNNLAVLYAGQGQYDKAKVALEMAIRTHPSYATAHENLGDIYAKMASQAYDRALQLDKSNTATQTKLALIKDLFTGSGKSNKPAAAATGVASGSDRLPKTPSAPAVSADATDIPPPTSAVEKTGQYSAREIEQVVHDWAAAWSNKNVEAYLAFYDADFKLLRGESRESWQAARAERLTKPKFIQVSLSNVKVSRIDDTHASVTFRQTYRSSHLKSAARKQLLLVNRDGNWLIQEERPRK